MRSDRMRHRLNALLDEADDAVTCGEWRAVAEKARSALAIEAGHADALTFLKMAEAPRPNPDRWRPVPTNRLKPNRAGCSLFMRGLGPRRDIVWTTERGAELRAALDSPRCFA